MTSPRPPLRLVGAPGRDEDAGDHEFAPVERAPHDLHAPYRELAVVGFDDGDDGDDNDDDGPEGHDDADAGARTPLSPRFVIVTLVVAQLLAASTFLGKYVALVRGDDAYKIAATFSVPAALCLYAGAVLLALRPGRGRALFIVAAAGFALALPFWGVGWSWSWPIAFGAILALAGAWFARAEVRPDESSAAQP
jgi:hypothetical protein